MAFSKNAHVDRATVHRTLKRQEGPSRKIVRALDLRMAYVPEVRASRKDSLNQKKGSDIAIVQPIAGPKDGQPILLVNKNPVRVPRAQVVLLACLYSELGCVVPYARLCRAIGHQSSQEKELRILRQHMLLVRRLLTEHKARCSLAVAAGVGYALCEVAQG
jgi:DNA-binding response OmpR family regulator